ncbi:hypothetical protein [Streptosporangium sp. CA-115845]|uniref:hypothetical protein n=1 Tax=Streptosporangium sp. CA-115845 TaxID=3240071 RepID=UPI003D94147F
MVALAEYDTPAFPAAEVADGPAMIMLYSIVPGAEQFGKSPKFSPTNSNSIGQGRVIEQA